MKFTALIFLLLCTQAWAKWSVTTFNVRNFDRKTDQAELAKILNTVKSDVYGFQEIVDAQTLKDFVTKNLPGYQTLVSSCGGGGRQKLAVAFNAKTFSLVKQYEDLSFSGGKNGKCGSLRPVYLVTLKNKATKEDITFGLVHLKAGGSQSAMTQRWKQYAKLLGLAIDYEHKNLVLMGDFNTTGYNIRDEDFERFEDFINIAALKSTSEQLGCTSFWTGTLNTGEYESSILDHVVLQNKMAKNVQSVKVAAHCARSCAPTYPEQLGKSFEAVSDHCPIQVSFK